MQALKHGQHAVALFSRGARAAQLLLCLGPGAWRGGAAGGGGGDACGLSAARARGASAGRGGMGSMGSMCGRRPHELQGGSTPPPPPPPMPSAAARRLLPSRHVTPVEGLGAVLAVALVALEPAERCVAARAGVCRSGARTPAEAGAGGATAFKAHSRPKKRSIPSQLCRHCRHTGRPRHSHAADRSWRHIAAFERPA